MRGRSLNKRIELWSITSVSDGFGGYTTSTALLSNSWANVKTFQPGRQNNISEFGLTDPQNTLIFTLRKRNDLVYNVENMYVIYRGVKYTISTSPTNVDFNDSTIVFMGVAESVKSNEAE